MTEQDDGGLSSRFMLGACLLLVLPCAIDAQEHLSCTSINLNHRNCCTFTARSGQTIGTTWDAAPTVLRSAVRTTTTIHGCSPSGRRVTRLAATTSQSAKTSATTAARVRAQRARVFERAPRASSFTRQTPSASGFPMVCTSATPAKAATNLLPSSSSC